jgi:hypothetical protein
MVRFIPRSNGIVSTTPTLMFASGLAHGSADAARGTHSAPPAWVSASAHTTTRVPAMVVIACLPLPVTKAVVYLSVAFERLNPEAAALIGFAGVLAYLAVLLPAMVLVEPFAIIASIWYTQRHEFEDPVRLCVCWLAVIVHTAVLISYFRLPR